MPGWVVLIFVWGVFLRLSADGVAGAGMVSDEGAVAEKAEVMGSSVFKAWCECRMVTMRLDVIRERYPTLRDEVLDVVKVWDKSPYAKGGVVIGEQLMTRLGRERAMVEGDKLIREWMKAGPRFLDAHEVPSSDSFLANKQRARWYLQLIRERARGTSEDDLSYANIRDELILHSQDYVDAAIQELRDGRSVRCNLTQDHGEQVTVSLPLSFKNHAATQLYEQWDAHGFGMTSVGSMAVRSVLIDSHFSTASIIPEQSAKNGVSPRELDEEMIRRKCDEDGVIFTSCEWTRVGGSPALFYRAKPKYAVSGRTVLYAGLWIYTNQQYVSVKLTVRDNESAERAEVEVLRDVPLLRAIGSTMRVCAIERFAESYQKYLANRDNLLRAEAEVMLMKSKLAMIRQRYAGLTAEADEAEKGWDASPYAVGALEIRRLVGAREGERAEALFKETLEVRVVKSHESEVHPEREMAILALNTEGEAREYLGFVRERSMPDAIRNPVHSRTVCTLLKRNPRYFQNPMLELADGYAVMHTLADYPMMVKIQVKVPCSTGGGKSSSLWVGGVKMDFIMLNAREAEVMRTRENFSRKDAVDEEGVYALGEEAVRMYCGKSHTRTLISCERTRVDGQPAIRFTDTEVVDRVRNLTSNMTYLWILGKQWHVRCSVGSDEENEGIFKVLMDGMRIEMRGKR